MEFEYLINQLRSNSRILYLLDLRTRLLSINMTPQMVVVPDKDDDYKVSIKYRVDKRIADTINEIEKQILANADIIVGQEIQRGYPKELGEKFLQYLHDSASKMETNKLYHTDIN